MAAMVLKKHPITQIVNYCFLLPFLPALRPILINFRLIDIAIYGIGIILIIALIIYGNLRPLMLIEEKHLAIYLNYRHNIEIHPYREISAYKLFSPTRITLYSESQRPVSLLLKKSDMPILINTLKERNINAK